LGLCRVAVHLTVSAELHFCFVLGFSLQQHLFFIASLVLDIELKCLSILFVHPTVSQFSLLFQKVHVVLKLRSCCHSHFCDISLGSNIHFLKSNFTFVDLLLLSFISWVHTRPQSPNNGMRLSFKNLGNRWVEIVILKCQLGCLHWIARRDNKFNYQLELAFLQSQRQFTGLFKWF
jgi:hypothetical protein